MDQRAHKSYRKAVAVLIASVILSLGVIAAVEAAVPNNKCGYVDINGATYFVCSRTQDVEQI